MTAHQIALQMLGVTLDQLGRKDAVSKINVRGTSDAVKFSTAIKMAERALKALERAKG